MTSPFSHSIVFLVHTRKQRFQITPLWRVFSNVSVFGDRFRRCSVDDVDGALLTNNFVTEAKLSNYADDNQLTSSDIDPEKVQAALVWDLEITSKWFRDCSLTPNLDKCKLVVLPERKSDQVELCIDGSQVKAIDNVELLGVVIDNRLNLKSHLSKLIKKVGRQNDVLKSDLL